MDPETVLDAHGKYGLPLAFVDGGASLVTGGFDGALKRWSVPDGVETAFVTGHERSVNCGAVTSDGTLVTGSTDATLRVWGLPDLETRETLVGHAGTVAGLAAHPTRPVVASAAYDATVRLWDLGTTGDPTVLEGHPRNVTNVAFVGSGAHVASGGVGDEAIVWGLDRTDPVARLSGHGAAVAGVAASTDGDLWTVAYDGLVRRWSAEGWRAVETFALAEGATPSGAAVDPVGGRLAVTVDGGLLVFDRDGRPLEDHAVGIKGVSTPRWSPDGERLAVGGADGKVRLYA